METVHMHQQAKRGASGQPCVTPVPSEARASGGRGVGGNPGQPHGIQEGGDPESQAQRHLGAWSAALAAKSATSKTSSSGNHTASYVAR